MPLDPQRVRFNGKAFAAAHSLGGSLDSTEAKSLLERLYQEWVATGQDLPAAAAWLTVRLPIEFKALREPPVWVEEEPSWPFLNGRPMTFVSQASAGELSPGETVYLFGARQPRGSGFEVVYRAVSQFKGPGP